MPEKGEGGPVVVTSAGAVRGVARPGSAAFLGIPYARAPIGPLRFAAPVPPEPWTEVRDATAFGATPQRGDTGITLIPEPSVPGTGTLNVNVYTPHPDAAGLPVLVWIHGGGYVSGSPASPWYDGGTFARDGVVVVTLSYRLGFDGFGWIDGAPANRGVRDWIAALEWVQENIAAFGGDPSRVTIAGQSAGGGAVLTLLGMPAAQHLFSAAWSVSGALGDVPRSDAEERSRRLAALAGVTADRDGFARVPDERLHDLQERAAYPPSRDRLAVAREMLRELAWGPMVDGDLLPEPTPASLAAGVGADKPLLLGSADDEFTMVTARMSRTLRMIPPGLALGALGVARRTRHAYLRDNPGPRRAGTAALLGRYVSDRVFRHLVPTVADARTDAAAPTWAYRFSWRSPVIGWAAHCLDVPFWFDCLDADRVTAITGPRPPAALAAEMHGAAVDFVRTHRAPWSPWSGAAGAGGGGGNGGAGAGDVRAGTARVFDTPAASPPVIPDAYASTRALS
ncbi:carboxylesterase family protein [Microbacterium sp. NPDC089189]|uniref:carboxylesterase/lipase family protein n=1 Tax=Microbacterium sp. NPDC089189 TaxID=3154972 RepID=UPI003419A8AE